MKTAIIVGAGPAGLTAAYELLKTTDVKPIVLEENDFVGGISRTAVYKGNRMDIGGHRFFVVGLIIGGISIVMVEKFRERKYDVSN